MIVSTLICLVFPVIKGLHSGLSEVPATVMFFQLSPQHALIICMKTVCTKQYTFHGISSSSNVMGNVARVPEREVVRLRRGCMNIEEDVVYRGIDKFLYKDLCAGPEQ